MAQDIAVVYTIINTLKRHGIVIQRYDDVTTNSLYLKLDYGVLKSIRISDHDSKDPLHCLYNLQHDLRKRYYDKQTKRFFYPTRDAHLMLRQILKDHNDKKRRFGAKYKVYMTENSKDNAHKKGFWSNSTIV